MRTPARLAVILPAAGQSRRLALGRRKAFVELDGRPLILHTVSRFRCIEQIVRFIVAFNPADLERARRQLGAELRRLGVTDIISGGPTRTETVKKCLELVPDDCTIVVIHDGARPLVHASVIRACIDRAADCGAAIAAVRMYPTVKEVDDRGMIVRTVCRRALWAAQTPQVFRREVIVGAYSAVGDEVPAESFTDDAAVVERQGLKVAVVEDKTSNIKVTTREDLVIAQALLAHEGDQSSTIRRTR